MADERDHALHVDGLLLPVFLDIGQIVVVSLLMGCFHLLVQEEAACVQVVDIAPSAGLVLLLPFLEVFVHLLINEIDSLLDRVLFQVGFHMQRLQMTHARYDVFGDVGAALSAGKP